MSTWPAATGPTHSLSRYVSGRVEQAALLGRGEHRDGVGLADGDQVRALERIDRDVDLRLAGHALRRPARR